MRWAVLLLVASSLVACGGSSKGWTVTTYYTAVERFHSGTPTRITGCLVLDCAHGKDDLGTYPADFIRAVKDEGTGRTAAGRYLNWSHDVGYWLDDAPRDSFGNPLRPFESAAADRDVLPTGASFVIVDCGQEEGGEEVDPEVCDRLKQARWTVSDEFTPGLGGKRHVDVYLGEETRPGFTETAWYATLTDARLGLPTLILPTAHPPSPARSSP